MAEDRLSKMKEIMARAQAEKEFNAKEEAERAQRETEAKGAERAQVEQELAASEQELSGLETQLGEAEKLAVQMNELSEDMRSEFNTELVALRSQIAEVRNNVTNLNERKQKLDAELATNATTEAPAEAVLTEAEPETNTETEEKPEPNPEESAKALRELLADHYKFRFEYSVEKIYGDSLVKKLMKEFNDRKLKVEELQKTLKVFERKDLNKLTENEKSQLKQAMEDSSSISASKQYDEKWGTSIDAVNEDILSNSEDDLYEIKVLKAKVAILKGEKTPDRMRNIDLIKRKEMIESLTDTDKAVLLEKLQMDISKGEKGLEKEKWYIEQNKEALRKSEFALRGAEREFQNSSFDLSQLRERLVKKFGSVL